MNNFCIYVKKWIRIVFKVEKCSKVLGDIKDVVMNIYLPSRKFMSIITK